MRDGRWKTLRRAKPASALQTGDAIRLESGKRRDHLRDPGFAPTDQYIEWRGRGQNNWANVPLDAAVRLAWHFRRVWTPRIE